jgi:DNA polymerase elongation subunit (family B)
MKKALYKKDQMEFKNKSDSNYLKLVFNSQKALDKSKDIFKENAKFLLYESNFEPFLRYCHIQELKTVGWVKIDKYENINESSTALNVQVNYNNVSSIEKNEIANFLQMSWNIECYSYNYAFPDPEDKRNEIFQIGSVFKYYKSDSIEMKHLLTLKKINNTSNGNLITEECKTEKELILKWVKLVHEMDPDIMYTYNSDKFSSKYLIKRSEIYNIQNNVLQALSRLKNIPSIMKKEIVKSKYDVSYYYRFYIPGRLNYDLLSHYRRGLKKYSSYQFDNISNKILQESRHDVSAKDIFKSYKKGDPNDLYKLAEYCIQDCELFQKLVDKQNILPNLIQLANIMYVPISYLLMDQTRFLKTLYLNEMFE